MGGVRLAALAFVLSMKVLVHPDARETAVSAPTTEGGPP